MSTTTITATEEFSTVISLVDESGSSNIVGTVSTEIKQIGAENEVQLVNIGVPGRKGDQGEPGIQGPEYQGDDLPDFTLIFENKLI